MSQAADYKLAQSLKIYIYPLLLEHQDGLCAECAGEDEYYEIDHIAYGDKITLKDLQLLCYTCHKQKTMLNNEYMLTKTQHCRSCTCWLTT